MNWRAGCAERRGCTDAPLSCVIAPDARQTSGSVSHLKQFIPQYTVLLHWTTLKAYYILAIFIVVKYSLYLCSMDFTTMKMPHFLDVEVVDKQLGVPGLGPNVLQVVCVKMLQHDKCQQAKGYQSVCMTNGIWIWRPSFTLSSPPRNPNIKASLPTERVVISFTRGGSMSGRFRLEMLSSLFLFFILDSWTSLCYPWNHKCY